MVLGVVTAATTLLSMAALDRFRQTASALEFLGPLGVAVVYGSGQRRLLWPGLAAVGVVPLTQPGRARSTWSACSTRSAPPSGWAGYILLTQRGGDEVAGINGLAVSMPIAGLVATLAVGPSGI